VPKDERGQRGRVGCRRRPGHHGSLYEELHLTGMLRSTIDSRPGSHYSRLVRLVSTRG
jgi:hypothetical protein